MPVKNRFAELLPQITAWRRDFHMHPELQFETHRTSGIVADALRGFGCDNVVTGIGRTGVVGVIHGRKNGSGRVIGLRADMDALPIHEETGVEYASTVPGHMHACGHDGHTAMLLGAAQYLAETRNFDGTVVVIFQPAEEGGGGGREMVEDGLMERFAIQEVYGMHSWPGVDIGQFQIRPGPFFAASDIFDITITGEGCHGAKPHEGVDPVVAAAQLITAVQTITSRNVNPVKQGVVTVASVHTEGDAYTTIPVKVHLRGTARSLDLKIQDQIEDRLRTICTLTAQAMGCQADLTYQRNYPVMVNAAAQTQFAADVACTVAGRCAEAPLVMGGEDFAFLAQARPGAYILLGNGPSAGTHHPKYNFNDEAIPAGCSWWAGLAEQRMPLG